MGYRLCAHTGDCIAVPQLVFAQLQRADGDTLRVALYLLHGGAAEPRTIAHDLALKSTSAAERALQFWAGAGLLEPEKGFVPLAAPRELTPDEVYAMSMNDPLVSTLVQETQTNLGRMLGHKDLEKLVGLYASEHFAPDVILLCTTYLSAAGKHTVAAVDRELHRWRESGVETGEDAEKYLRREEQRGAILAQTAQAFGVSAADLTQWEKRAIVRWSEEWSYGDDIIREAVLRADSKRTVRYVDGILRAWHAKGWHSVSDVRGSGALQGSNILSTGTAERTVIGAVNDPFQQDWSALFDNGAEG